MTTSDNRIKKLRKLMRRNHASGLLVSSYANVTYLTGFTGDSSYLLVTEDDIVMITDFRFTSQLEEECPWLPLYVRPTSETMDKAIAKVVKKSKLGEFAVESQNLTLAAYHALTAELKATTITPSAGWVEKLRLIKDKGEIEEIRKSVQIAEKAFGVIKAAIRGDQTEKSIAADLEHQIRLLGGIGFSFPPIVGVGPRAALPHGIPSDKRVDDDDFILIDWGAVAGLYLSDLTRVLVTGRLSQKLQKVYHIVLEAQLTAIELMRPGAIMSDIDAAAREVISNAGYGKYFGHGLGHGIGLEIHEAPRLGVNHNEPLKAGMVITVEPGIYLPGWGGVRIEDDVLVTRTGHEVLSSVAKDLESCVVT